MAIDIDGFDEAFLFRSDARTTNATPAGAPEIPGAVSSEDVRAHYHARYDFDDDEDEDLARYADYDAPDALQEVYGAPGAPGGTRAASVSSFGGSKSGVAPGFAGAGVAPVLQAFAGAGDGTGPTRTAETEKSYMKRSQSLLRQCAEALLGDRLRVDEIEPMQFVAWAVEHRESLSKASWRQYKAAIRYWLNTIGTSEARQAALLLESKNSSVCLEKTERTSGRRRKSYDHRLFHDFLDHIVVVAPRTPFARYAGILRTWLMLGYLTGLRPHEWCQSEILRIPNEGLPAVHGAHENLHGLPKSMQGGPASREDLGNAMISDLVVMPSREFEDVERDAGFLDSRSGGLGYEGKPGEGDIGGLDDFREDFQEEFEKELEEDWSDGEDDLFEDIAPEDLDADSDEEILAILYGKPVPSMIGSNTSKKKELLENTLGHPEFLVPGRTYLKVKNSKHTNGRAHGMYRHLDVTDFGDRVMGALDAFVCYMSKLTRVRYKSTYDDCRLLLAAVNESFFKEGEKYIQLYSARHFYASNAKKHMAPTDVAAAMGHANDQTAYSFYGNARYGSGGLMARPVSEEAQRVRQVRKLPGFLQAESPDVQSTPGASGPDATTTGAGGADAATDSREW